MMIRVKNIAGQTSDKLCKRITRSKMIKWTLCNSFKWVKRNERNNPRYKRHQYLNYVLI